MSKKIDERIPQNSGDGAGFKGLFNEEISVEILTFQGYEQLAGLQRSGIRADTARTLED